MLYLGELVKIWPLVQKIRVHTRLFHSYRKDPVDFEKNRLRSPKLKPFIMVLPMIHMCQYGQNLAIGSEVQTRHIIFIKFLTLVTLKIRSQSPKSVLQNLTIGSEDKALR